LAVVRRELEHGLPRLLERSTDGAHRGAGAGLLALTRRHLQDLPAAAQALGADDAPKGDLRHTLEAELTNAGNEGFTLQRWRSQAGEGLVVVGNTDRGVLYGTFHLLRLLQTQTPTDALCGTSAPRIALRMLNHWDNLDRTVERGYAGASLWDWQHLPDYTAPRYTDYARAMASIGLNAASLINVNSNARVLTAEFLEKIAALADVFRPYGIRVFLSGRFSAPVELGELDTADPLDPRVLAWWKAKVAEIYDAVHDFGGFVVKANSEGQPGPQDYGRSHADGANLLADALLPHGGIVIWRAFVYDHEVPDDRAKQAYDEFVPRDGEFRANALIQVKNGPIDFQPREPFHPLFGAMPKTPLVLEFQLTQEYLGFASHLVYMGGLFQELLAADTHVRGPGSSVAKVVDGSLEGHTTSGIAAVSNIGTERNWCGHPFAQANWYAFGRFAWDHELDAADVAEEWLRMTFSNAPEFLEPAKRLMLESREICVNYMTPLGLHHIMAWSHHYGPGPWIAEGRPDWTSVYYHRADSTGIGFDRTETGSNAVGQYAGPVRAGFANLERCPENLLLWFHHLPWTFKMRSGRTLWDELCHRYHFGADAAGDMQRQWSELETFVDPARFAHVSALLAIQAKEARWWRDACVLYFQTFSQQPIPNGLPRPAQPLEHYRQLEHHYVPGN
jgi:alpha-glucuronidase